MAKSNVISFGQMMKDLFPLPGQPVKEWVLKARAERAELERTGKRVSVEPHDDNCGSPCRNVGPATLVYDMATHDCCGECNDAAGELER